MIFCFCALIISSETIKFFHLFENFYNENDTLSPSQKRNQIIFDHYNQKYNESIKLSKNIPKKYNPTKSYHTWNKCDSIVYNNMKKNFNDEIKFKESYCFSPNISSEDNLYQLYSTEKDCIDDEKKQGGIWSPPCKENNDCPFYQANKNYENEFGKCNDGKCELPLGVFPLGNRHYKGEPLCHRCIGMTEPSTCCEIQKNEILYDNLLGPDYAFKNDEIIRFQNNLL